MDFEYIPGSSAAPKASLDSKSFSEEPNNFGRKTKKYLFKKVDLAAEIFSFQESESAGLNTLWKACYKRTTKISCCFVLRNYWELAGVR